MMRWLGAAVFLTALAPNLSVRGEARQVVKGHVLQAAAGLASAGHLADTNRLELAIGLRLRNGSDLTNLIQGVSDPASAQYRHYLTPEEFTAQFGPSEADYQSAIDFARANGLEIRATHPNRMLLEVAGSVSNVEKAFNVTMRLYRHPDEPRFFYAPDTEPSLDARVPAIHVSGLNNYKRPQPMNMHPAAGGGTPEAIALAGTGPNGAFIGKDFRAAYAPGTALTGAGQSVGLFELDGYYSSDIAAYRTAAGGLASVLLKNVLIGGFNGAPSGNTSGSGNEEVALDIEMALSMAPGLSQILVYEGTPSSTTAHINAIFNRMATDNLAKQLSVSWGFDIDVTTQQIFQQFAAQGQSVFLASGDSGAFKGNATEPSDTPYLTVVGGTTLTTSSSGAWSAETVWNGSGGGSSTVFPMPEWQQGIDMSRSAGSRTMRNTPDVAMIANKVWVTADNGQAFPVSGTSIAAPLWASFAALVNQQAASKGLPPVGFLNPAIYAIGKSSNYSKCFQDIVTGNNFSTSSPHRFSAVAGYDLCTGWGTPKGAALIDALSAPSAEPLVVRSPLGFTAFGPSGGSFSKTSQTYSLTNISGASLDWAAGGNPAWLDVSPAGGTLAAGEGASVKVALTSAANALLLGTYTALVRFTNMTDGVVQSRQFNLLVGNGGFETGDFSNWTLAADTNNTFVDSIDSTELTGSSTIPGVDDSLFTHEGLYGAFLGESTILGHLSQTIPTVPGQTYLVSFWMDNPAVGVPNEFQAKWAGKIFFDQSNMGARAWTNIQYVASATGTATSLQFGFRNDQNGFGLDGISVQLAPAPVIQSVSLANDLITLNWGAIAGASYQLQYTDDIVSQGWTDLGSPIVAAGTSLMASEPASSPAQRFYRVVLKP